MERVCLSRDDKGDGFDASGGSTRRDLVGPGNFAFGNIEGSSWEETHSALWIRRLVFG